jgi:hypothetical protein
LLRRAIDANLVPPAVKDPHTHSPAPCAPNDLVQRAQPALGWGLYPTAELSSKILSLYWCAQKQATAQRSDRNGRNRAGWRILLPRRRGRSARIGMAPGILAPVVAGPPRGASMAEERRCGPGSTRQRANAAASTRELDGRGGPPANEKETARGGSVGRLMSGLARQ